MAYIEDPLPHDDVDGLVRLSHAVDVEIVGHDYVVESRDLRDLVQREALQRIRVHGDFKSALECVQIAKQFGVPLIFENSLFELSVHAAVAFPFVDRLEFSDLAWNRLPILAGAV